MLIIDNQGKNPLIWEKYLMKEMSPAGIRRNLEGFFEIKKCQNRVSGGFTRVGK